MSGAGQRTAPQRAAKRRAAARLSFTNAGLWALGDGLLGTSLVVFLAKEFGAAGLGISLILAAPAVAGLLRMAAPALIARCGGRKRVAIAFYLAGAFALTAAPLLALGRTAGDTSGELTVLIVVWCVYHVLEYIATVALWAWLGDLFPRPVRGRLIGQRERWLVVGRVAGMLLAALALSAGALAWGDAAQRSLLAAVAAGGVACFAAAVAPLALMPRPEDFAKSGDPFRKPSNRLPLNSGESSYSLSALAAPFVDRRFAPLLVFGVWFSLSAGLTQSAQNLYPYRVLGLALADLLIFRSVMRTGQAIVSPTAGRLADRLGNRRVLVVSLLVVATGPLFFLLATEQQPYWLAGAFVVWIAYAGMNVGLPNLMLRLAPAGSRAAYVAAYFTVGGLAYSLGAIAGGIWLDGLLQSGWSWQPGDALHIGPYELLFWLGIAARILAVVLLLRIPQER